MKTYKAIVLALIAMSVGCGKISSDSEADLTKLRYGLINHVEFLKSESSPTSTANQFYLILDYWNDIKSKHKLPHSFESRINNSMYFYKFSMVGAESFSDMSSEKERSFEEEKKQGKYWMNEAQSAYNQIDSSYWKVLEKKHLERNGKESDIEYLHLLSKEMTNRGFNDMLAMINLAGSALDIMFEELQNTLDK